MTKYGDYKDSFDDEENEWKEEEDNLTNSLSILFSGSTTRSQRTDLYKNYKLLQKPNLIQTNKSGDLLFAQMNPIRNQPKNIVVTLKNAFDKIVVQITEFELANASFNTGSNKEASRSIP
jgi:hypothetical protein